MIGRNITRRLERLEEITMPVRAHKTWQIIIVDSDGSRREGEKIEWQAGTPVQGNVPAFRKRYR